MRPQGPGSESGLGRSSSQPSQLGAQGTLEMDPQALSGGLVGYPLSSSLVTPLGGEGRQPTEKGWQWKDEA